MKRTMAAVLLIMVGALLAACEDNATPTAVSNVPTATATQAAAAPASATSAPTAGGTAVVVAPSTAGVETAYAATPAASSSPTQVSGTPRPTSTPNVKVEETASGIITRTLLMEIDVAQWVADTYTASPDQRHGGYISAEGIRYIMHIDGAKSPNYIGVLQNTLVYSPDSQHHAYAITNPQTQALVLDDVEQKNYQSIETGLVFSPDSKHIAYGAAEYVTGTIVPAVPTPGATGTPTVPTWHFIVLDKEEGKRYEAVTGGSIFYSADSTHIVYLATQGGKQIVVSKEPGKHGTESKPYESIFALSLAPDSKRVGIAATVGDKRMVVVDGVEGKQYDGVGQGGPVWSADSKHYVYLAQQGSQQFMVLDGTEGKPYEAILGSPVFSPDGKRLAYVTRTGSKMAVVIHDLENGLFPANGHEEKQYEVVGSTVVFSPDSKRTAYVAGTAAGASGAAQQFVVVDGQDGKHYDGIGKGTIHFSPDNKQVAYVAGAGGKQFVVVDGVEGKHYDGIGQGTLTYSPDGKHLVYTGAVNVPVTPVPQALPTKTPPRTEALKQFLVLDGQEGPQEDVVAKGGFIFTSPADFHYQAIRNRPDIRLSEVYVVEQHLK